MKRINIIGTGRVGRALGYLWSERKILQVVGLFDRNQELAQQARDYIAQGTVCKSLTDLPPADFYMISVPDDHITAVAKQLARLTVLKQHSVVFHCSGALPANCLAVLRKSNVYLASLHPVLSITHNFQWPASLSSIYFTIEGDVCACDRLSTCLKSLAAHILPIACEHKLQYHIALVFASNFLISLIDIGQGLLQSCGIEAQQALAMLEVLSEKSVHNAINIEPSKALTGPIARGDTELVAKHINYLQHNNPVLADIYRALANVTNQLSQK